MFKPLQAPKKVCRRFIYGLQTMNNDDDKIDEMLNNLIWGFIKSNPAIIVVFLLFLVALWLSDIVIPHVTGKIVNAIQNKAPLMTLFIIVVALIASVQLLSTASDWIDMKVFPNVQQYIRQHLITHLFNIYRNNFAEVDNSVIIGKMIKLPYALYGYIDIYRYYILPQLITFAVAAIYIGATDPVLSLTLFVTYAIIVLALLSSPKMCSSISEGTEKVITVMSDELDDIFTNLVTVYSKNTERHEMDRLDLLHNRYESNVSDTLKCMMRIKLALFPVVIGFICIFVGRSYVLVQRKKIDTGKFVSLFMIMGYLSGALWRMINQVKDVAPRYGRIRELMSIYNVSSQGDNAAPVGGIVHSTAESSVEDIVFDNVSFAYNGADTKTLDSVSLVIPIGQRLAIVGTIGSGKSTIIKLLMKYYKPDSGEIYWRGQPYTSLSSNHLRSHVGYVNQTAVLFNRTIYENIVYGLPKGHGITHQTVLDILTSVGIGDIFWSQPNGMDAPAGRKGSHLSGGQRQIVWLLRILFQNPEVLILDEPTASVDDDTKVAIYKMLQLVMKGKTTIIVTHDPFFDDKVERTIRLHSGRVVSDTSIDKTLGGGYLFGYNSAS